MDCGNLLALNDTLHGRELCVPMQKSYTQLNPETNCAL